MNMLASAKESIGEASSACAKGPCPFTASSVLLTTLRAADACAERSMATPSRKGYTSLARNQADNHNDSRFYDEQLRSDGWCAAVRRACSTSPSARCIAHTRPRACRRHATCSVGTLPWLIWSRPCACGCCCAQALGRGRGRRRARFPLAAQQAERARAVPLLECLWMRHIMTERLGARGQETGRNSSMDARRRLAAFGAAAGLGGCASASSVWPSRYALGRRHGRRALPAALAWDSDAHGAA